MKEVLTYPFETPPAGGTLIEVADGVFWLRMPLPFRLNHVNLWLLADGDGWTVVDTGFASDDTRGLWQAIFDGPARALPPKRLIVTHYHPDHFGLAGWLTERWGLPLYMTRGEWLTGQFLGTCSAERYAASEAALLRRQGAPDRFLTAPGGRGNPYARRIGPLPLNYRRIKDGDGLTIGGRTWTVVVGEGHAPEQATLWCEDLGVLISGDQVLPQITPNVSLSWAEPDADPLAAFLTSLERFNALPADTLVLPSHRLPFRGLHQRVDSLIDHHRERLEAAEAACRKAAMSSADLLPVLFRPDLDDHQFSFAIGEASAHAVYLAGSGRVGQQLDDQGVLRFAA